METIKTMEKIKDRRSLMLMAAGIAGCILMGASDWLMIYGDISYKGQLAWLTQGVAEIEPWRNSLAMALAFPAVLLYSTGLFAVKHFIEPEFHRKIYSGLTAFGMTPWLCLHLLYIMIFYMFSLLTKEGNGDAVVLCQAVFNHFSWIIPVAEVIMILPFIWLFVITVSGRTLLPGVAAVNNPLIIFAVMKGITKFMEETPFKLAFTNGLMSESMLIFFILFIIIVKTTVKRDRKRLKKGKA